MNNKAIKDTVRFILKNDEKSRSSDKYLYSEVIKVLAPHLQSVPLCIAIVDNDIPCYESVRRARQWCQNRFPSLRANYTVQQYREALEEEYKEIYG